MNLKYQPNIFHLNEDVNLMVENVIQNKIEKFQCECKKSIKHCLCEKVYLCMLVTLAFMLVSVTILRDW